MNKDIFTTSSRKLEQFLFVHDIFHTGFHKDDDNMTVWEYPNTPEVMEIVEEFREIQRRRKARSSISNR